MFKVRKDSVSYNLAVHKNYSSPTLGAKNVTQYCYEPPYCAPGTLGKPDIWLGQVNYMWV